MGLHKSIAHLRGTKPLLHLPCNKVVSFWSVIPTPSYLGSVVTMVVEVALGW